MTVERFLVLVPGDEEKLPLLTNESLVHMGPELPDLQTAHIMLFSLLKLAIKCWMECNFILNFLRKLLR